MTENQETCRKCGSPLKPGMKFCESCGARIEAPTSCPQCGTSVAPSAKFCESCGTPLVPAAPPVSPAPGTAPASPPAEPAKAEENPVPAAVPVPPAPETAPAPDAPPPAESPVTEEKTSLPLPEEHPAAAVVKEPSKPEKAPAPEAPKETAPKKPVPQQTVIIAAVIVLALLGAAVLFIVLPMLSGPGTSSQNQQVVPSPTGSAGSVGSATTVATGQSASVSFIPGPTDVPPYNRAVVVDVERDAITSIITVTFQGGEGQYGVRELAVTLTRSDGTVETKSFKPEFRGTYTTLQGTQKTDRVEVTANFYNGESYKIIDQIFEYKKRGG